MAQSSDSGFTLLELLVIIIILGVLSAVIIPQFGNVSLEARESALLTELATIRHAIKLYEIEHGKFPGVIKSESNWDYFIHQLTSKTDKEGNPGNEFGPYIRDRIPANPLNSLNSGIIGPIPDRADDKSGWFYDSTTGEIRANSSGSGPSKLYYMEL